MLHRSHPKARIVFLFSDTGGGHRSAAEAIREALELEFPGRFSTSLVDAFRKYTPPPFKHAPEIYPPLSRMPDIWRLGYHLSDGSRRTRLLTRAFLPYVRNSFRRLVRENPADLYVSVHPLLNSVMVNTLKGKNIPFVTVVTDMVTVHAAWYEPRANLIIVPTETARQTGIKYGVSAERIKAIGQPVADRFCHPVSDKSRLRKQLGWLDDRPVILLVGGGEGMGPLQNTAQAINEARLPVSLVIIAGRNQELQTQLDNTQWNMPVKVYGFVREMPDFMAAADILITKAGPGTVSEAFIAGLPMILYTRMPGQEDGNVSYVVQQNAGVWAPTPEKVVETLQIWLNTPGLMQSIAQSSHQLARPEATRQIARLLAGQIDIK